MSNFLAENRRRLKERFDALEDALSVIGVKLMPSKGTLMAWADFRHLLKEQSANGETALFMDLIQNYKICLSSGASCFASAPGFFRICFAYPYVGQSDDVAEAM